MRAAVTSCLCMALAGCAYVGDPLPPSLKIPEPVKNLSAVQRGDKIYVDFTPAALTTDGVKLDPSAQATIWIGEAGAEPATEASKTIPVAPWTGKDVVIGTRTRGPSGRWSAWSNFVTFRVQPPVAQPQQVKATAVPAGIEITWQDTAPRHRIYRDGELMTTVDTPSFTDTSAQYGKTYEYTVQALVDSAESEISAPATITPEDRFAPEAPGGLTVLAGAASAELSWDRSPAPDLAFYRIYRDGKLLADRFTAIVYSDSTVRPGGKYRYAVTAVDQKLNESPQSAPVEIAFP